MQTPLRLFVVGKDAGFLCGFWFPQWQKLLQSVWSKHLKYVMANPEGMPEMKARVVYRRRQCRGCGGSGHSSHWGP